MELQEVGLDRLVGQGRPRSEGLLLMLASTIFTSALTSLLCEHGGIVAAVLLVAGIVMIHHAREGFTIDRTNRLVTVWWGIGLPFHSTTSELKDHDTVCVGTKEGAKWLGGHKAYPVNITGSARPIPICQASAHEEARRLAHRIARFLSFPVVDTATGSAVRLEADEVGLSLRERLRRSDQDVPWREPPVGMRCTYQIRGDAITINVPIRGLTRPASSAMLFGMGLLAFALLMWFATSDAPPQKLPLAGRLLIIVGSAAGGILLLCSGAIQARERRTIDASPSELCVTHRWLRSTREVIPADDLQELTFKLPEEHSDDDDQQPALIARSDQLTIQVDTHLSAAEFEWVCGAILYTLAGSA